MIAAGRYSPRSAGLEAAQGGAGIALTVGLIRFAEPAGPVIWALTALAALFLVYFGRAVVRFLTRFELDERAIRASGPLGIAIPWAEVRALRLDYYTTRSDRSGGWMQLVVRGARGSIRIDSNLTDFDAFALAAAAAARRAGCALDERTRANLRALGFTADD